MDRVSRRKKLLHFGRKIFQPVFHPADAALANLIKRKRIKLAVGVLPFERICHLRHDAIRGIEFSYELVCTNSKGLRILLEFLKCFAFTRFF